ncbi:unnamed protein product [Phaedon cochleariae]|uniref:Uncharacterized protein n=1 Tax=Phaedon cochleariae TaxID=80249 RepID=A0A9N9SBC9_PHACE|nr:unnamed protein product [Phaedon cochleariae]
MQDRLQTSKENVSVYFYEKVALCGELDLTFQEIKEQIIIGLLSEELSNFLSSRQHDDKDDLYKDIISKIDTMAVGVDVSVNRELDKLRKADLIELILNNKLPDGVDSDVLCKFIKHRPHHSNTNNELSENCENRQCIRVFYQKDKITSENIYLQDKVTILEKRISDLECIITLLKQDSRNMHPHNAFSTKLANPTAPSNTRESKQTSVIDKGSVSPKILPPTLISPSTTVSKTKDSSDWNLERTNRCCVVYCVWPRIWTLELGAHVVRVKIQALWSPPPRFEESARIILRTALGCHTVLFSRTAIFTEVSAALQKSEIVYNVRGTAKKTYRDESVELTNLSSLRVKPCLDPRNATETTRRKIQLIQKQQYVGVQVYTCLVMVQQFIQYYGMHSHTSSVAGGLGKYVHYVSAETCLKAHQFRHLNIRRIGGGIISKISLNGTTEVSTTFQGHLDMSGKCESIKFTVGDISYKNVVVSAAITIKMSDYFTTADVERNVVNLRSETICPYNDGSCFDDFSGKAIWKPKIADQCTNSGVDVLYGGNAKLLTLSKDPPTFYVGGSWTPKISFSL